MNLLRFAMPALVSLVGGIFIGTQIASAPRAAPETATTPAPNDQETERQIAALTLELEASENRVAALLEEAERLTRKAPEGTEPPVGIVTTPFTPGARAPRVIASLAEAPAAFERALLAGDLEGMWLLAADVLAYGEAGYPVFEEHFAKFFEELIQGRGAFRNALRQEELYMGRFLRTLAEQHEDFLAYGLHLVNRDVSRDPPPIQELKRELFDDDLLPVILAFHGGENPDLTAGWLDVLEAKMSEPKQGGVKSDTLLFGLAQIPDPRAADLIAGWLRDHPSDSVDVLQALIAHGSERALGFARQSVHLVADDERRADFEQLLGM